MDKKLPHCYICPICGKFRWKLLAEKSISGRDAYKCMKCGIIREQPDILVAEPIKEKVLSKKLWEK